MKTVFQVISKKGISRIFTNPAYVADVLIKGWARSSTPLTVTDEHFKAIVSAAPP